MSKHIGRKQRWTQENAARYVSHLGTVVYQQQAWYGLLDYKILAHPESGGGLASWDSHALRLGPFKRPRNAMVEAERHGTMLRNQHGERARFAGEGIG